MKIDQAVVKYDIRNMIKKVMSAKGEVFNTLELIGIFAEKGIKITPQNIKHHCNKIVEAEPDKYESILIANNRLFGTIDNIKKLKEARK